MAKTTSRRSFLAGSLSLPAALKSAPLSAAQESGLPYATLGKTGLRVTRLGFGGTAATDPSVAARAIDMGINYIDSARVYLNGNHERMIGGVIKGRRQNLVVESKTTAKTRDAALRDLEASLKELGTDYLDIWHLHGCNTPAELPDELFEAQRTAKQQGKIRFAGVSMHFTMKDMIPYLVKMGQTDVILTAYNFSMPPEMDMENTLAAARKAGIGIAAMKVMAGGFNRIQRGDRLYTDNPSGLTAQLKKPGAMIAAMKWVLRNPSVDSAVIGMANDEQVEEDIAAVRQPFTDDDRKLLAAQLEYIRPLYCRMCGACTGQCPEGLPVGEMLRILSYADGYGQFPMARERFRDLPRLAREVRCENCNLCSVHCPHGVRVQERLTLAQNWLA